MSEHIVSSRLYYTIWIVLLVLTGLTAWISTINLGPLNTIVALVIASGKASIVALFFMHLKYTSEKHTRTVVIASLFWVGILFVLSMADYFTRATPR